MTTCQNLRCANILKRLAEVTAPQVPMQLSNLQSRGMDGTYTANMETEEVDTGALVRFEVTVDKVTIFEPGEKKPTPGRGAEQSEAVGPAGENSRQDPNPNTVYGRERAIQTPVRGQRGAMANDDVRGERRRTRRRPGGTPGEQRRRQ